jgi:allantoate deiminase
MIDRARRAIAECQQIASMTEEPGRITRRFLTPAVRRVHAHLRGRMEAPGMAVSVDAVGNLRGLWRPQRSPTKRLIIGSHIDTVPDAGAFDGVLGVTLALELVLIAREMKLPVAIEVIAFSEEEGVRFGVPFLASRAVAGRFDTALLQLKDSDGLTLEDAIHDFGLNPAQIAEAAADENASAFLEIHIEQGPVLEAEGLSLAAVSGIVGQTRLSLEFVGHANHAGTTPMHLRHDALAGAAEWMAAVEQVARRTDGLVSTVGKIVVSPNAGNVIAGTAEVSLDARHLNDKTRINVVESLLEKANAIASRRGLAVQCNRQLDQPAVSMDERLTAFLTESMEALGSRLSLWRAVPGMTQW